MGKGFFKSITGKIGKIAPSHFKVKTANATIGVRGTTIIGEVTPKLDIIACTYGQIVVTTDLGSVVVNQGERTVVMREKSPRKAQKVNAILLKKLDSKSDVSAKSDTPAQTAGHTPVLTEKEAKSTSKQEADISESITEQTTQDEVHSLEDIQQIVGTQKPLYEGKVTEGTTSYGAIRQDGVNDVRLGFDLGAGTMDGKLQFEDTVQQYDIDVAGRVKQDGSFDFNSQNGYDGGGKGALEGEKYEHANGSFDFEEKDLFNQHSNKIQGKFETNRK
ncbi:MAG TPA: hypothetical protein ENL02_01390 [Epsilonproteobacteria bacterium]|nr:hypothetical protein [Campylobacterota bacterium]